MGLQYSYASLEKEFAHELRDKLNHSEDGGDVSNMFAHIITKMLNKIFGEKLSIKDPDIIFEPSGDVHFSFSRRLLDNNDFTECLENSDMGNIVSRFADSCYHRYLHLNKHLEKNKLKIRN